MPLTDNAVDEVARRILGDEEVNRIHRQAQREIAKYAYNHALEEAAQVVTERREGYLDYYTETRRHECQGIIEAIRALKEEE